MLEYKNTYKVVKVKDKNNKQVNLEDSYIICAKSQIYRYNSNTLAIIFYSNKYANNRIKELESIGVQLTILQRGDDEQTYTFKETDLEKVAEVCKARKRFKRNFTEEQREVLKQRMINLRSKNDS